MGDLASILRLHIVAIAVAAAVVFSWVLTGRYAVEVALLGGLDWILINLLNRISDVREDLANGIRGTGRVAARPRVFLFVWILLSIVSLGFGAWLYPELTGWRVGVQVVGVGYSYSVVLTPRGWRRFKDLYVFKNLMSGLLFVTTCFVYPIVTHDWAVTHSGGVAAVLFLVGFFLPYEITYEILYDLRDLEGDRLAGVPTFPVVHGIEASVRIIDGLLLFSSASMVIGVSIGVLGLREALMIVAPCVQFWFYRHRLGRGLTRADCIGVTNLGTAMLLLYLVGTYVWAAGGLPANVFLVR